MRNRAFLAMRVISTVLLVGALAVAQEQQKSPWKDQAEYDLVQQINKTTDPKQKIQLLNQWKEKYPEATFAWERLNSLLGAHQQAGDADGMRKCALEMIQVKPKEIVGYYWMNLLTLSQQKKDDASLADGEKAAKGMLDLLPTLPKPANATDAQWAEQKKETEATALKVLGWTKMTRNDHTGAEKDFTDSLKVNPNDAQVSLWTGQVVLRQKDDKKQAQVVWHYCRAGGVTGKGALDPAGQKQMQELCKKYYLQLREVESGLNEFSARATKEVIPPADLEIKAKSQEDAEKYNEILKTNPDLAVWMNTKKELEGAEGDKYFKDNMKDTLFKNKGKIISHKPEEKPTELVVGLLDGTTAEVTLKLSGPLPGKADAGTEITFEGVPTEFVKDPFNVSIEVEREKVGGWPDKGPMPPITAPRKVAPVKKGVAPVKRPAPAVKKK